MATLSSLARQLGTTVQMSGPRLKVHGIPRRLERVAAVGAEESEIAFCFRRISQSPVSRRWIGSHAAQHPQSTLPGRAVPEPERPSRRRSIITLERGRQAGRRPDSRLVTHIKHLDLGRLLRAALLFAILPTSRRNRATASDPHRELRGSRCAEPVPVTWQNQFQAQLFLFPRGSNPNRDGVTSALEQLSADLHRRGKSALCGRAGWPCSTAADDKIGHS